jgi:hypothetical protein
MNAGPTDHAAVDEGRMALGFILWRLAERHGLVLWVVREPVLVRYLYFVVVKSAFGE